VTFIPATYNRKKHLNGKHLQDEEFAQYYTTVVPLFHSAGVYSSFSGIPQQKHIKSYLLISGVPVSTMLRGKYRIEGKETTIGLTPLVSSGWALQDIVAHLQASVSGFQVSLVSFE
jgi:hypothetical protein